MTAEIAILNRSAVALAADSAVTLGFGNNQKIFNTVDKLFELVRNQPVGIMIFGGAEYMNIPYETIIKKFRDSQYAKGMNCLKDYSEEFFKFLEKEISVPLSIQISFLKTLLDEVFIKVYEKSQKDTLDKFKANPSQSFNFDEEFTGILLSRFSIYNKHYEDKPQCDNLKEIHIPKEIEESVLEFIKEKFGDNEPLIEIINKFSWCYIKSEKFSSSHTGIVFAGFGKNEIFPKLHVFNVEGYILGKVKRKEINYIDIDREGTYAHIEPFAQKEMVERFIDGIDASYERYINSTMKTILSNFSTAIIDAAFTKNTKKKRELSSNTSNLVDQFMISFEEFSQKQKITEYRNKILNMVRYMPKSDIANMAESLVNLTSTKRKVSAESETVGGPVDVAVISKYDGFIWIKRKHYFSPELNPRFFGK